MKKLQENKRIINFFKPANYILALIFIICLAFSFNVLAQESNQSAYDEEVKKISDEINGLNNESRAEMIRRLYPDTAPDLEKYYDLSTGLPKVDFSDPAVVKDFNENFINKRKEAGFEAAFTELAKKFKILNQNRDSANSGPLRIEPIGQITPGEEVTLKAGTSAINPSDYYFYWFSQGTEQPQSFDLGQNTFTFKMPPIIGATQKIKVVARPTPNAINQTPLESTITINTADIDLSYEARSYVPPQYKGRRLASSNSEIVVEAIPFFSATEKNAFGNFKNKKDLFFTWNNNAQINSLPVKGAGKSRYVIQAPGLYGGIITVGVTVEDPTSNLRVSRIINIKVVPAQVTINKATETGKERVASIDGRPLEEGCDQEQNEESYYAPAGKEYMAFGNGSVNLKAEPYFFSIKNPGELEYKWSLDKTINANSVCENSPPYLLTLNIPSNPNPGQLRTSGIYVETKNKKDSYQFAQSVINIRIR